MEYSPEFIENVKNTWHQGSSCKQIAAEFSISVDEVINIIWNSFKSKSKIKADRLEANLHFFSPAIQNLIAERLTDENLTAEEILMLMESLKILKELEDAS